jgi:hypothetical protein
MSQDGQRFTLVMLFSQAGQIFLPWFVVAQKEPGSFGKGPLEVGVANLLARGAQAFATRFLGTCDEAAIRGEVLHAWAAINLMDFRRATRG